MAFKVDVSKQIVLKINGVEMRPKNVKYVDDEEYVSLGAEDGFTRVIVEAAGLKESLKKQRPTIRHTDGYECLRKLRNEQQAADMVDPQEEQPQRRLFAAAKAKRQKKRSAQDVAVLREQAAAMEVNLGHSDTSPSVLVLRPVAQNDELYVKADDDNLTAVLEFILDQGVTSDDLLSKRAYRSSGNKGVWKFGKEFRKKQESESGNRWPKVAGASERDGADKSDEFDEADEPLSGRGDELDDLPAADLDELPSAEE